MLHLLPITETVPEWCQVHTITPLLFFALDAIENESGLCLGVVETVEKFLTLCFIEVYCGNYSKGINCNMQ